MLEALDTALDQLQRSRPLIVVVIVLTYALATVLTMLVGAVRDYLAARREERLEREAAEEYERISHGWNEENSDEWSLTNETYHEAGQRRSLFDGWRQRVAEAAQPVMETYPPQRQDWATFDTQVNRWPEWTMEELATPGRHRLDETLVIDAMPVSPGQGYTPRQLRALVTQTGQFSIIGQKELVGVGS